MINNKFIIKNIFSFVFFKYLSFAIGIIGQIWITRLILPEIFSKYIIAISILEIIFFISAIGLNTSVLKYQNEKDIFDTSLSISLIIAILLIFLSFLIAIFIPYSIEIKKILVYLAIIKSLSLPISIYSTFYEKDFKQFVVGIIELISKLFSFMIAIIFIKYFSNDLNALLMKDFIYNFLQLFILFLLIKNKIKLKINQLLIRKLYLFSYKNLFLRFLEIINKQIPILFLSNISKTSVSFFERNTYLVGLPNALFSPLNAKISYTYYTKFQTDFIKIKKAINLNLYITIRSVLPIFIIVFLFSKNIIYILLGEIWLQSAIYLKGLSFVILFMPIYAIFKFYIISKEKFNYLFIAESLSILSLVIGSFIIYKYKLNFYLLTYFFSLGYFLRSLFLFYSFFKELQINLLEFLMPYIYMLLSCYLIIYICNISVFWQIFFILAIYIVCVLVFERKKINAIFNLIKGKQYEN